MVSHSHKRPYTVATLFFFALFLLSIFLFFSTRTTFQPAPSIHSDLYLRLQPLQPSPPPLQHPPPPPQEHQLPLATPTPPAADIDDVTDAEPDPQPVTESVGDDAAVNLNKECDLFTGTWVKDENYPIYQPGSCPYVDEAYDCKVNGRTDTLYTKWRWKPDGCDLPSLWGMNPLALKELVGINLAACQINNVGEPSCFFRGAYQATHYPALSEHMQMFYLANFTLKMSSPGPKTCLSKNPHSKK